MAVFKHPAEKEKNRLVAKLEAQGYTVTLEPAA
jgi:hypothetical protein